MRSTLLSLLSLLFLSGTLLAPACKGPTPSETTANAAEASFERPGFTVIEEEGRLWVFRTGSAELAEFQQHGELGKHTTRIGVGPGGRTLKSCDAETIDAYLQAR